jgi:hypothetical protein
MLERRGIPQSELPKETEVQETSTVLSTQTEETERLKGQIVRNYELEGYINPEQFEQRVKDAMALIAELSDIDPLQPEGREKFATNARISLENFIVGEVIEHGVPAEKLKKQITETYEFVKDNNEVCVNLNYKTLFDIISAGGSIKSFEDLPDEKRRRREGTDFFGRETNYRERRTQRDSELGINDTFVVGALGTINGYDEVVGPAPFYGHGTLRFDLDKLQDRTTFYEGDSMTNQNTASTVIPNWLLRKWDDRDTRKLDVAGAKLSKALMDIYTQNRDLSHVHLMYVEAHITGDLSLADAEGITYAIKTQEEEKKQIMDILKNPKDTHERLHNEWLLQRIEGPEQERDDALDIIDSEFGLSRYDHSLEIKTLKKPIEAAEDPFQKGTQTAALRKDSLF